MLAVVYVMFNEGFVSSTGATQDRDLAADAVWLAGVVATSVPHEPEAWGLAALLTIQHARAAARFDEHGGLVLLRHQDRSRWDHAAIADGERLIERAGALRRPGRYQLQAAIAALHATAPSWEETDWLQIVMLYDVLARLDPSPVVLLNQAVARAQLASPPTRWPSSTARRPAGVVPPLPRRSRRAAQRPRPPRRGPRGQPHRPRPHQQRRRAPAAHHPAAPASAGGRLLRSHAPDQRSAGTPATAHFPRIRLPRDRHSGHRARPSRAVLAHDPLRGRRVLDQECRRRGSAGARGCRRSWGRCRCSTCSAQSRHQVHS